MIKIEMFVSYPGLSYEEESRLVDTIRSSIVHDVTASACKMKISDEAGFIRPSRLDVSATVEQRSWIPVSMQAPTPADANKNGDVLFLRSGEPILGRVSKGIPVDATHWHSAP